MATIQKPFQEIEDFEMKALEIKVDNETSWEDADEEEKENRDDTMNLQITGSWLLIPSGLIKGEVERIFPSSWKENFQVLAKKQNS